jgi:dUTP pyrophosphatase
MKIKLTHPNAKVPTYGTPCSACFDLYAVEDAVIPPGEQAAIPTGLRVEIPADKMMKIYSRSGHGFRNGVRLANGTGIIDCDYREELMVLLRNDGKAPFYIKAGNRIAQARLEVNEMTEFEVVDELSNTERNGGLGSTGA